jgi:NAD(P)-dependent dehydrogenase (short-subunit alcohol dehydrogenase family)
MTVADNTPVPDYFGRLRLEGRPFVVLGAGQGIGRQTTHALRQAGASLVCVDREADLAEQIASEVGGTPFVGDIMLRADVERALTTAVDTYGSLHGVVDIVGASRFGAFLDQSDDDWQWTLDIVLRHAVVAGQVAGRIMSEGGGGGVIAYVASISALTSAPMHAAYGAAKAALMSLVRSMAVELGPAGIRVNAVAPGGTLTPRIAALLGEAGQQASAKAVPLGRMAQPADIAAGLLFLLSDLADFVTGQVLVVDGGGHVKYPYSMDFVS